MVGGINFQIKITNSSRENTTNDRLETIQKAINEYIILYGRLPCPSNILSLNGGDKYGEEVRDASGNCDVENSSFLSGNIIYGSVPNKTLNLTDDYGVDAWKNVVVYAIDRNYGTKTGFSNNGGSSIFVKNINGDNLTNEAVYVLFSGGENQNGVFKNGVQKKLDISVKDHFNSFKNNFDNSFIKDVQSDEYDDLLFYKTKKSIVYELDMQDMPCNLKDLTLLDSEWQYNYSSTCTNGVCKRDTVIQSRNQCPKSSDYSKNPNSDSSDDSYRPVRKCLKYGQWSDILYSCGDGCGESNIASVTGGGFSATNELRDAVNVDLIKRVKRGEEVILECLNSNMTGYITLLCKNDGTWEYRSGTCINKSKILSSGTSSNTTAGQKYCSNSKLNSNNLNLVFSSTSGTTQFGGVVYGGACATGYSVVSNGNWSIKATCLTTGSWQYEGGPCGKKCDNTTVVANNTIKNGEFPSKSGLTDPGQSIYGGCAGVYKQLLATCQADGSWLYSGGPCEELCQNSEVNKFNTVANSTFATVTGTTPPGQALYDGACNAGYTIISGGNYTIKASCETGGKWTYTGGPCGKQCDNSMVNTSNTIPYSVFSGTTGTTNPGYYQYGGCISPYSQVLAKCEADGSWTYTGGPCSVACYNSQLANTSIIPINTVFKQTTGGTGVGSTQSGNCISSNNKKVTATCKSNGAWSFSGSSC